ncbi:MAG TPA: VOC family protein [Allosphingosinicella sp.]|jgi:hypothetical protein
MADKFIWYELMTTDLEPALGFYREVVGWSSADHEGTTPGGDRYVILSAGGRAIGGAMQLSEGMLGGGARPGWFGYVGVADTDVKAREVEAAGGKVLMGPGDIPTVGRFAFVTDAGGAPFYLLTPQPRPDAPPPPAAGDAGGVAWHELQSGAGEAAAFAFYSRLFGWETMAEMPMGPMGSYRIFGADGEQLGGMMDKPEAMPVSAWQFYFTVDGIDAAAGRVRANGGAVVREPHQVPDGSWIIHGRDPQGAVFALNSTQR